MKKWGLEGVHPSFPGGEEAVPVLAYKEGSTQKSNLF